jgi:hypothetical protein
MDSVVTESQSSRRRHGETAFGHGETGGVIGIRPWQTVRLHGGRSSAGRASVCGTEGRGFEPRRSPGTVMVWRPFGRHTTLTRPRQCRCGSPRSASTLAWPTCASSSTAEQRTLNPQVLGSKPRGRTANGQVRDTLICSLPFVRTMTAALAARPAPAHVSNGYVSSSACGCGTSMCSGCSASVCSNETSAS